MRGHEQFKEKAPAAVSSDLNKCPVLPLTLPNAQTSAVCTNVWGLYCKACTAVNTADRLRCYKRSPQAQQCTTVSYTEWASDVSIEIVFAPAMSKNPIKHTHTHKHPGTCMLTNAAWHHACTLTHIHRHQPGNSQTGMHNKGKSSWAPQLISCMEIIFKTEQNGGPSLGGRVGLRRAPGAGWHVTVYACLLNKRCWPRWKSAIGHLICPTCVIGSCPNTQYSCLIERERRWSRMCAKRR